MAISKTAGTSRPVPPLKTSSIIRGEAGRTARSDRSVPARSRNNVAIPHAGNALDELRRVIAVLQSPHAHTTALPPTPVSYDLLQGFPGKLFQGVQELQGLQPANPQQPQQPSVNAASPPVGEGPGADTA